MTEINRAGQAGSLGHIDTSQGDFRNQIDALTDSIRQLGGKAQVGAGIVNDPLNSPYVLYVDSNIGSDKFVSGDYSTADDGSYEQKMKRISLQRLECGYTASRPFKSVSRAVIEAGIITSRDYLTLGSVCGDLITIVIASGVHTALNGSGSTVTEWLDGKDPTDAELQAFNPTDGGIPLPRGCSIVSLDLRKTIVRPDFVPAAADEAADLSNRKAIFRVTGGCYAYGFTFMDKLGATTSHHLLDAFQFCSKVQLDEFYAKIRTAFDGSGATGGIDPAFAVSRTSEYLIVGPQPAVPTEAVDTTASASPYIYNVSLRSELGMCGLLADGSAVSGSFRSMVVAQYTSVSLQKDLTCWQKYSGGTWVSVTDYADLINTIPDNVRFKPGRYSVHVRTINEAVVQLVSVFAIGQSIHYLAESGSQITVTNSNSNFGGVAALAEGFQPSSSPNDGPFSVDYVRRSLDPFLKEGNIQKIFLGVLSSTQSDTATTLTITSALTAARSSNTQPAILDDRQYSLKENDYLWVENPGGPDYRAQLAAAPWNSSDPDELVVKAGVTTDNSTANVVPGSIADELNKFPSIAGKRVYVRRLLDTRTPEERRYSIVLTPSSSSTRVPITDYVIQQEGGTDWTASVQAVAASQPSSTYSNSVQTELRYSKRPTNDVAFSSSVYYRKADVVTRENKHWSATRDHYGAWNASNWQEAYVHMEEDFGPEGYYTNAQPIVIFDKDTAQSESSATLGNSASDTIYLAQIESGVDYLGLYYFLSNLGLASGAITTLLSPQTDAARDNDVTSSSWVVEYRRPTNIRLFSHAYEWAGYGSYSKALPQYQGDLSEANKFNYFFTNSGGGKVYVSGFTEEGFRVTPRGLEDLTTGKTIAAADVGSPDIEIDFPTVFADLEVTNSLTVKGLLVRGASNTNDFGFTRLAGLSSLVNPTIASSNADIDNNPNVVTPEGLAYWQNSQRLVQSLPSGVPYALLHVCSASGTPLTGNNSIPYGQETNSALEWTSSGNAFHETIFTSLTEAVEKASQLFLPTGSTIVISVHDDLGVIEQGPIQLVNGFTRFDVAGARGATTTPTVRMKWGTTANACARIPQYSSVNAFSAGAVFADLTLELDNNNQNSVSATFNGGYGVGGRNTIVNWSNVGSYCCAATCSYGGDIVFQFYNTDSDTFYLTNNVNSTSSASVRFNLTGSDTPESGLTGHGCNLIVDLRETGTLGGLRFVNGTGISPTLSLLDLGKRGGVKCGGRVVPELKYDFSNHNWDLSELIGVNYSQNQNFQGKAFRADRIVSPGTASTTYNINSTSLATVAPVVLRNGCCCDVEQSGATAPLESGFLSILGELEKDPSITVPLLTADNTTNSFVYNDQSGARNV